MIIQKLKQYIHENQLIVLQLIGLNLLFVILPMMLSAQSSNIGIPPIYNFSKEKYNGSTQNWDIAQDETGIMYFANNTGLLVFDGKYWESYPVDNQTIVRSVKVGKDGKIFIGAQSEMGYFAPDVNGKLKYNSLNHLLPESDRKYADVWDIEIIGDKVYFKTGNGIFLYENDELKIIYIGNAFGTLTKVKGQLLVYEFGKGIMKLQDKTFTPMTKNPALNDIEINGIFSFHGDTLLISTIKDGLFLFANDTFFPWQTNDNNSLKRSSIYCSTKINENTYAFGTATEGVFIINKKGEVLQNLNRKSGLQINNVLSLYVDNFKNIWAGLNNGIDYIETSSPFTFISPKDDLKSTGYAIQIHNNKIYFGTATGVYQRDWKSYYNPIENKSYQLVQQSAGQVWDLSVNKEDLFLNHHDGTFIINNNVANKITAPNGSWMQVPVGENKLISGHYNGLLLFEKNKNWKVKYDFNNNFRESCRVIVQDENGAIWVAHPYRGLHKINFNQDFSKIEKIERYGVEHGFKSDLQIYAFKIGDEIVFCAEEGIYKYNETENKFEPNNKWNDIFGEKTRVKRLIEAENGDIWYVTDAEVGILDIKDGGIYKNIKRRVFPKLGNKMVDSFEAIYPFDKENVFVATEDGFIHYNPLKTAVDTNFNALIRLVQLMSNDSIIYHGNDLKKEEIPIVSFKNNALRFRFSATYFSDIDKNEFQYFLEGFDKKWSNRTTKTEIEYTNLSSGTYTLHVKAINENGTYSKMATYSFKIAPPWYASKLAYIIYFLLIALGLFFLIIIPKKQFEREKAALQSEQKQTLLEKEQTYQQIEEARQHQISKLEKEKLELQIKAKNQELASNTMHLVQKSEILRKLKTEINTIVKTTSDEETAKSLRKVIRKLLADERLDNDWEQFAKYFDQVHGEFLKRLRKQYDQLTPKDHRLCAYLRMNLTTKEIAPLMNISVRSVEVARYRLRKKLSLSSDVNLVDFMMSI